MLHFFVNKLNKHQDLDRSPPNNGKNHGKAKNAIIELQTQSDPLIFQIGTQNTQVTHLTTYFCLVLPAESLEFQKNDQENGIKEGNWLGGPFICYHPVVSFLVSAFVACAKQLLSVISHTWQQKSLTFRTLFSDAPFKSFLIETRVQQST